MRLMQMITIVHRGSAGGRFELQFLAGVFIQRPGR
jgi:hypothetical protein